MAGLSRVLHRRPCRRHHPDHVLRYTLCLQTICSNSGLCRGSLHFHLEQGIISSQKGVPVISSQKGVPVISSQKGVPIISSEQGIDNIVRACGSSYLGPSVRRALV